MGSDLSQVGGNHRTDVLLPRAAGRRETGEILMSFEGKGVDSIFLERDLFS